MPRASLEHRLLVLLVTMLVVTFVTIGAGIWPLATLVEYRAWHGRQAEAARNAGGTVGEFIAHAAEALNVIGRFNPQALEANPGLLQPFLQFNPALLEVIVLDADGRVLADSYQRPPVLNALVTISQSNWFLRARQGQPYLGHVEVSASDLPYMVLAVPGNDGRVAAARLSMDRLWQVVDSIRFGATGQVYVVDPSGRVVGHPERAYVLNNTTLAGRPELAEILAAPAYNWSGAYANFAGVVVVGAAAAVPGTDWIVVAEVERSEASAMSEQGMRLLTGGLALLGLLIYAVGRRVLRREIVAPIELLRTGAERLGQGDMAFQLPVTRNDELGQVAEAFNRMSGHLRDRQQELRVQAVALAAEVAELARTKAALQVSEERYALALQGANDGLWDWDLASNRVYFSERWKTMLGYSTSEVGSDPDEWLGRVHPDDARHLRQALDAHLSGALPHFQSEHRLRHRDGAYRWMLVRGQAIWDTAGRAVRLAGSQTDTTARKQAEDQMAHGALHDPLTDLPNRTLFMDRLQQAITRARRSPEAGSAVLYLDLDRFKVVNDSLGHQVGDQLLIAVAHQLEKCVRVVDTVARLGGDEFAILLEGMSEPAQVVAVAERIQGKLRQTAALGAHQRATAVSIGIALPAPAYQAPEEILRDADTALYRAKEKGRDCYQIFDAEMHAAAVRLLRLESDLRQAVARDEWELHFQPIVAAEAGTVLGLEALLRWRHPERGLVYPGEFIAVAEDTGLIVPIGAQVLRAACAQARRWHDQGHTHLYVAVNLSPRQFRDQDVAALAREALDEAGLPPQALKLEITERLAMSDHERTIRVLHALQALGVDVLLDDFGQGYSSLSYLQRLPLQALKIDKAFIQGTSHTGSSQTIITAMIGLAHSLRLAVIAEGVETASQFELLRGQACDAVQGYWLHRPAPPDALEPTLAGGPAALRGGAWDGASLVPTRPPVPAPVGALS